MTDLYLVNDIVKFGVNCSQPKPFITLSEYAERYMYLPSGSALPGKYRLEYTPFWRDVLDDLSPQSPIQKVVVCKSTQVGATTIGLVLLSAIAHLYPCHCLWVMPSDNLARLYSQKVVEPLLQEMPHLKGVVPEKKSREAGAGMMLKLFPGGSWAFTGSGSTAKARSQSIKTLVIDDVDGCDDVIRDEGDSIQLFEKRTDAFGASRKIYVNSTPTVKGFSAIERQYNDSSKGEYHVPCPYCKKLQLLRWGGRDATFGIKFSRDKSKKRVLDAWYICKYCKQVISESNKNQMMSQGEWIHEFPDREVRGYRISALLSPSNWVSWKQIAQEFIDSQGNQNRLQVWFNTRMAETYESPGSQPDYKMLMAVAEPYDFFSIPRAAYILTAGVDVQDDRLSVAIYAWGVGAEVWLIWWGEIFGDPINPEPWDQLLQVITRQFKHPSGVDIRILSTAIDTGGHRTNEVYKFCRKHANRGVIAVKGASIRQTPLISRPSKVDVNLKGQVVKGGLLLWPVGTHAAKDTIYGRLNATMSTNPGVERFHFPLAAPIDYYRQLTAERKKTRFDKGHPIVDWVLTGDRCEALDCTVYAFAAAEKIGVSRADWDSIKKSFEEQDNLKQVSQSPKTVAGSAFIGGGERGGSHKSGPARSRFLS